MSNLREKSILSEWGNFPCLINLLRDGLQTSKPSQKSYFHLEFSLALCVGGSSIWPRKSLALRFPCTWHREKSKTFYQVLMHSLFPNKLKLFTCQCNYSNVHFIFFLKSSSYLNSGKDHEYDKESVIASLTCNWCYCESMPFKEYHAHLKWNFPRE